MSFITDIKKPPIQKIDDIFNRVHAHADTTFVINFWATWCGPCVKELPYFEQIDSAYHDHPVKVLLVSVDFPKNYNTRLVPFIEKNQLRSEVIHLNEKYDNEWIPKVDTTWQGNIPATLIIRSSNKSRFFIDSETTYSELSENIVKTFR